MRFAILFILAFFSQLAYSQANQAYRLDTLAEGLNQPWSMAFLPNGDYLIALRVGELRRLSQGSDGWQLSAPLKNTPDTYFAGQGGYFDITLDPDFADNQQVYLSFAYGTADANGTRIVKATLGDDALQEPQAIFTVEPLKDTAAHYGGRMQFLADNTLIMTTGDGFDYREAALDRYNQMGKIIRIERDGSVPADNPFADGKQANAKVYSYGHRNPQGLDIDAANGRIFMHEHGPQGGDEVNLVVAGGNYGWPATSHGVNYSGAYVTPLKTAPGVINAIKVWVPSIAPSGLAYFNRATFPAWRDSLFSGALVDKNVSRLQLKDGKVVSEEFLFAELEARIRDVRVGPDGLLYILTDGEQGKLVRVSPQ